MTIYLLHIFDRMGNSLFSKEWCRPKNSNMQEDQEKKLIFGMIHSIKSFVEKMSPKDSKEGFIGYTTSKYKLHFYETPTGVQFVLMTDVSVGTITDTLKKMYSMVYVKYAVMNSLVERNAMIGSSLFESKLDAFVRGLPFYEESKE